MKIVELSQCCMESAAELQNIGEQIKDEVNHPGHYTSGKYETIDIIKDSVDDYKSFVHGNIIKYILRYKHKGGIEDLKKAQVYLNWLIKEEECRH